MIKINKQMSNYRKKSFRFLRDDGIEISNDASNYHLILNINNHLILNDAQH